MQTSPLSIPGTYLIEPRVHPDDRGYFFELYHKSRYESEIKDLPPFVQDNLSKSTKGCLRGLHYQLSPHAQGKLLSVLDGEIFDAWVDIRPESPTFGHWDSVILSAENAKQVYLPPGIAHGFYTLSETAILTYKCTAHYHPESDRSILWSDPKLGIDWPLQGQTPLLSQKDIDAAPFDPKRRYYEEL